MKKILIYNILMAFLLMLLPSCKEEEPTVKRRGERQIYVLSNEGCIYDLMGDKIMELPNCEYASEIISDGDDYFVSGKNTKGKVGYWKNGKWNTLHVDFIDDVNHDIQGMGKWDYYIFLFDYPNILKNSGIFPLDDSEGFDPIRQCLAVSNGKCYVTGRQHYDDAPDDAVLYYEHKGRYAKAILPKPSPDMSSYSTCIFAYDTDHTIVGGHVGSEPCIWVDQELQLLPRMFNATVDNSVIPLAHVNSVARVNGHTYAAGYEKNDEGDNTAMLWVDGVPQEIHTGLNSKLIYSYVLELVPYGDDLYMLTFECSEVNLPNGGTDSRLDIYIWMNDRVITRYNDFTVVNFTVV